MINDPLAIIMRPKKLNDILGQEHLIGKGKIIYNLIKNKKLFSMILYGKPGIGKTTIAEVFANELDLQVRQLNAVINNKKDFDIVVEEAKMYNGIVLIMDEIHRLNKDKQDLLLPVLESGLITLIGMTTSNPYHKINPAIRSRCQIFKLEELNKKDIIKGLNRIKRKDILKDMKITAKVIDYIADLSSGDIRFAYNLLEVAYYSSNDKNITLEHIKSINPTPVFSHDKDGDGHYDVLSGLQKSIRGSDVDAALHYLARLLEAGDLDSIYRRLSVIAYEDIGLANPSVGPKIKAAIDAAELVGMPEARIPLSVIVCELALSPKSNTAYKSLDLAFDDLHKGNLGDIPNHLKSPFIGYKYPHSYPNHYVKQQYLPENIKNSQYFKADSNSKYELTLKEIYEKLKN